MTFGILGNYANKGPCDSGFHIPTQSEFSTLYGMMMNIGGSATFRDDPATYQNYLFFPVSYYLNRSSGTLNTQYGPTRLWSCTMTDSANAYAFFIDENNSIGTKLEKPANGFNIRAFKDEPEQPDSSWTTLYESARGGIYWNQTKGLISIVIPTRCITIQDHNVGATTVWKPGDTVDDNNAGLFYQFGNNYGFPYSGATEFYATTQNVTGYGPENPYLDSHFVKRSNNFWFGVANNNIWGGEESGTKILTEPKSITYKIATGVEIWENETLGLVSITSDGGNTWTTIADKDLGATTRGGQGDLFQRGNCYHFPSTGTVTTNTTKVDVTDYGPNNKYNSSTWIRVTGSGTRWTTSSSGVNLWGGTSQTTSDRRGPCPEGFHVPLNTEWNSLISILGVRYNGGLRSYIYITNASRIRRNTTGITQSGTSYRYWWCSNLPASSSAYALNIGSSAIPTISVTSQSVSYGYQIRPFKDVAVVPSVETGWTRTVRAVNIRNINQIYAQGNKVRPPNATKIVLNAYTKTLAVGDTFKLTAKLLPEATKETVTWSTSDSTTATVGSSTGTITGVAMGTCTITGTTTNGLTAGCTVTVTA